MGQSRGITDRSGWSVFLSEKHVGCGGCSLNRETPLTNWVLASSDRRTSKPSQGSNWDLSFSTRPIRVFPIRERVAFGEDWRVQLASCQNLAEPSPKASIGFYSFWTKRQGLGFRIGSSGQSQRCPKRGDQTHRATKDPKLYTN